MEVTDEEYPKYVDAQLERWEAEREEPVKKSLYKPTEIITEIKEDQK